MSRKPNIVEPAPAAPTWILLRHGETNFIRDGRYQGSSGRSTLTDLGRAQALELRSCVEKLGVHECYCSPVRRARETLELLRPSLPGADASISENLTETNISGWEGRAKADLAAEDPNAFLLWRCLPEMFCDRSGDRPLSALYARISEFLVDASRTKNTKLVIGHDHVNRAIICSLLRLSMANHCRIPQATSSISIVAWQGEAAGLALHASNLEHVDGRCSSISRTVSPRLLFVRHAITHANAARIFQGTEDAALCSEGRAQASAVCEILAASEATFIISSTLRRAHETAATIAERLGITHTKDSRLVEFNYGRWQGLSEKEVHARFPEDIAAWRLMNRDSPIPQGESISALVGRVASILPELWRIAHDKGTVIVVAHDVVVRTAVMLSLRLPLQYLWRFPMSNCGCSELRLNEIGQPILVRHNILAGALEERYGHAYL